MIHLRSTLTVLFSAVALTTALVAANADRPNILWVVTEDDTTQFVGAYGDPLARTPTFDRLAKEGVLFQRAHSTAPVCAPCRASIITGMYAPSVGLQHMRSQVGLPPWLRFFPAYLRDAGYYTTNNAKTDYNSAVQPGTWDESNAKAHWRNRKPGQPFFSVFNFAVSHESRLHTRKPLETDPAKVRVPAYLPDVPEVRADFAQYYDCVAEGDRQITALLADLKADGLLEDTIIFYYGDNGGVLPRSKRFLYDNGTHVPLMVWFPQKYRGLAPVEPGTRFEAPVNLVDLGPTVLSLAGVKPPEYMQGRALAGPFRAPDAQYAYTFRDRMDERYDLSRSVVDRRFRYIRNYHPELPAGQYLDYLWRMASMSTWARLWREGKLNEVQSAFFRPRAAEEFFDLEQDPDNVRNLAGDPKYLADLERLRAANREHLLATRDLGFIPEAMVRARAGTATPVSLATDEKLYPLPRVLALLDTLQLGTPSSAAIAETAHDPSPVIRYWAAVAARRAPDAEKAVTELLRDAEPSVRVAAAATLLAQRDVPAAWEALAKVLTDGPNNEARLEAANVVANLPQWPESLRPALTAAASFDKSTEPGVAALCNALLKPRS